MTNDHVKPRTGAVEGTEDCTASPQEATMNLMHKSNVEVRSAEIGDAQGMIAVKHAAVFSIGSGITDKGMKEFADILAMGSMAQLTELYLSYNQIGDAGVTALAGACASGAMAQLTELNLSYNSFGDQGMVALSDALGKGALPQLKVRSRPYLCMHEHSTHPYKLLSHTGAEPLQQPDWRCWRHSPRGCVRQWVPAAAH